MLRRIQILNGVHEDLVRVVKRAAVFAEINGFSLVVLEGVRTEARQRQLYAAGASVTMNSRHLTGHAVDLGVWLPVIDANHDGVDDDGIYGLRWDWPLYHRLGAIVKAAAEECKVPIEWGGDWKKFQDGPHFQLTWENYPIKE